MISTSEATGVDEAEARRRFTRACVVGGALGGLVFVWMLTAGTFDLFRWQPVGDFYDAQAHSLLGGHLDVPRSVLGIEAFIVDDKAYMYQGPTPALLRLPVAAVTDGLDGRLTQVSMLAAFVVAMVFASRLHWRIRRVLRGAAPVNAADALGIAAFTFVLAGGSSFLFAASKPWVYHEALMWGLACIFVAFEALGEFLDRPRAGPLVVASAFTGLALMSRASVGVGGVAALALVLAAYVVALLRDRRRSSEDVEVTGSLDWFAAPVRADRCRWRIAALAVAVVGPVVAYSAVNAAKFGALVLDVPWEKQTYSQVIDERIRFLAENHNGFFGLKFVPQTALQYLRPDALSFTKLFPWVSFPAPRTEMVAGGVRFDTLDVASSVTASLAFFVALGAIGALVVFGRRVHDDAGQVGPLRILVLGALAGAVMVFPFGYIAQRYLSDALPLLVLLSIVGITQVLRRLGDGPHGRWFLAGIAGLAVLAVATTWINFSLGLVYQRVFSPETEEERRADFVALQQDVASWYSDGTLASVQFGDAVPRQGGAGELFVVGDCEALYVSTGMRTDNLQVSNWQPVERTNAAGRFSLRVRFPSSRPGTREPILTAGTAAKPNVVFVEYRRDHRVAFGFDGEGGRNMGRSVEVDPERTYTLDVAADRQIEQVTVRLGHRRVLQTFYSHDGRDLVVGRNDVDSRFASRFTGAMKSEPLSSPVCRTVRRRSAQEAAGVGSSSKRNW